MTERDWMLVTGSFLVCAAVLAAGALGDLAMAAVIGRPGGWGSGPAVVFTALLSVAGICALGAVAGAVVIRYYYRRHDRS
jgi:hypothetical protein